MRVDVREDDAFAAFPFHTAGAAQFGARYLDGGRVGGFGFQVAGQLALLDVNPLRLR